MRGMWANVGVLVALARSLALLAGQMRERRPALVVVTGGYAGGRRGFLRSSCASPWHSRSRTRFRGSRSASWRWAPGRSTWPFPRPGAGFRVRPGSGPG
jgi:hypothetical protein